MNRSIIRSRVIANNNFRLGELRVAMETAPTKRSYIRLNAIRLLLVGQSRAAFLRNFLTIP